MEISLMRLEQSKMLEIITKLQKESKERERDRIENTDNLRDRTYQKRL